MLTWFDGFLPGFALVNVAEARQITHRTRPERIEGREGNEDEVFIVYQCIGTAVTTSAAHGTLYDDWLARRARQEKAADDRETVRAP